MLRGSFVEGTVHRTGHPLSSSYGRTCSPAGEGPGSGWGGGSDPPGGARSSSGCTALITNFSVAPHGGWGPFSQKGPKIV